MSKYILMTNDEVLKRNIDEDDVREIIKEYYDIEFDVRLKKHNINDLTDEQISELTDRLMDETLDSFILVEDADFRDSLTEKQTDDYEFGDMKDKAIIKVAKECNNVIENFINLNGYTPEEEDYDF